MIALKLGSHAVLGDCANTSISLRMMEAYCVLSLELQWRVILGSRRHYVVTVATLVGAWSM